MGCNDISPVVRECGHHGEKVVEELISQDNRTSSHNRNTVGKMGTSRELLYPAALSVCGMVGNKSLLNWKNCKTNV